jgi:pimeloyl-ACP methyl ester carboxylesterase
MTGAKWLLIIAVSYVGVVALIYFVQRAMMYFPERVRTAPAEAGFAEAEEIVLDSAGGERVIAWHVAPRGEKPVVLYFHGNGGALRYRVARFRALVADGTGLVALSYRGYGGSSGGPTEAGLIADGIAVYEFAASRYRADRIVLWGESLGSGVAVAVAAEKPVSRVVLEAPFASAVEIAAHAYPFVPVRWLMKDQFRSDLRIGKVTAPVLILHGERDRVVPIGSGERLHAMIRAPKRFVRFPGAGHENLAAFGAVEVAKKFLLY